MGDSGSDAVGLANYPGQRREPQEIRRHRPSRTVRNDRERADQHGVADRRGPSNAGHGQRDSSVLQDRATSCFKCVEEADHVVPQFFRVAPDRFRTGRDQQCAGRNRSRLRPSHIQANSSEAPTEPVADYRRPHPLCHGIGHTGGTAGPIFEENQRKRAAPNTGSIRPQRHERVAITDGKDQADSLARPFARRLRRMARPARVDIR